MHLTLAMFGRGQLLRRIGSIVLVLVFTGCGAPPSPSSPSSAQGAAGADLAGAPASTVTSSPEASADVAALQNALLARGGGLDAGLDWKDAHPRNQRGRNPVIDVSRAALQSLGVQRAALASAQLQFEGGAGSGNFQLAVPVARLPGRGLDLTLDLNYNSQLWTPADGEMYYDLEADWPAPGWSLGFGKIVNMPGHWSMLVDADGTHHPFKGVAKTYFPLATVETSKFVGHTTDGTLIDYSTDETVLRNSVGADYTGHFTSAQAIYPNGTVVDFGAPGHRGKLVGVPIVRPRAVIYPTRSTDANGNFIDIAYRENTGPEIDTITDTLGRITHFYYDANGLLTAVTAPINASSLEGTECITACTTERTLIRLHYRPLTIGAAFAGPDPDGPQFYGYAAQVIDSIVHPDSKSGYWFGDGDSFSSYGMITKVSEQRGMGLNALSLVDQGVATPGAVTRQQIYNYPANPDPKLQGPPTYTTKTETWEAMDTPAAVTRYLVQEDVPATPFAASTLQRVEVIRPDLTRSVELTKLDGGLPVQKAIYAAPVCPAGTADCPRVGQPVRRTELTWEANPGAYDSPRLLRTETTDERNQVTAVALGYGGAYNQVTELREFDYDGGLLRRLHTDYETSQHYVDRHIFNLPTVVQLYDAMRPEPVSRTEYRYDGQPLADTPGVVGHAGAANPFAPKMWVPPVEKVDCSGDETGSGPRPRGPSCKKEITPGYWLTDYQPASDYRGNVTQTTTYVDAARLAGAITVTRRYDITGNVVTLAGTCCQHTSYTYIAATQYAYPTVTTRGAVDPTSSARVTTSASYDFNTGLLRSTTDSNGRTALAFYSPITLRLYRWERPTKASTTFDYDDAALEMTETTRDSSGVIAAQRSIWRNGLGLIRRQETLAPGTKQELAQHDGISRPEQVAERDIVQWQYDSVGRVWRQTRPFRTAASQIPTRQWSETFYDAFGRVTTMRAPDESEVRSYFNKGPIPSGATSKAGQTTLVVDAWGRERWTRTDALGRLQEVIEPNPVGSGSVSEAGTLLTEYVYTVQDRLERVVQLQPEKLRLFEYDSLGRLSHQYLPEKGHTLWPGIDLDQGSTWSDIFTYDEHSNLTSHTDARGVKAVYAYANDPLDRLQSVTYDTSEFTDSTNPIVAAPATNLDYMTKGDVTRLSRVTTTGGLPVGSQDATNITDLPRPQGAGGNQAVPFTLTNEEYGYDGEGRHSSTSLIVGSRQAYPQVTEFVYDSVDRLSDLRYPAEYGMLGAPRKLVHHAYDVQSRLVELTVDGTEYASQIDYNPANQLASLKVGSAGPRQLSETYGYDAATGLLEHQQVQRAGASLLDLSYGYLRAGTSNGRSGQLTTTIDNLNDQLNQGYTYDALGRLRGVTGGNLATPLWRQEYTYDRYGNRIDVESSGSTADGEPIPRDGLTAITYDPLTDRVSTPGFAYDAAGNQTRTKRADGNWQRYQYDAAGRLVKVRDDAGVTLETYTYGADRRRLLTQYGKPSDARVYYVWNGNAVLAEYIESASETTVPRWSKSYVHLDGRLLSTLTPGTAADIVRYIHTDRLGIRLITNEADNGTTKQSMLPSGVALHAESIGPTNRLFTTYDRSTATGLDYAVNRHYDSQQGRFTQVDPSGITGSNPVAPQTLNMYSYSENDPVNSTDPLGLTTGRAQILGWAKLYGTGEGYTSDTSPCGCGWGEPRVLGWGNAEGVGIGNRVVAKPKANPAEPENLPTLDVAAQQCQLLDRHSQDLADWNAMLHLFDKARALETQADDIYEQSKHYVFFRDRAKLDVAIRVRLEAAALRATAEKLAVSLAPPQC